MTARDRVLAWQVAASLAIATGVPDALPAAEMAKPAVKARATAPIHPSVVVAQQAREKGDYRAAVDTYNQTIALPKDSLQKSQRAELENSKGRTFVEWSKSDSAKPALLDSAAVAYRVAKKQGKADSKAVAKNGLALVYLRKGDPKAAARELADASDDEVLTPGQRSIVQYNLGRSLAAAGDTAAALEAMRLSIQLRPDNDLAVDEAFSMLLRQSGASGSSATTLAGELLTANRSFAAMNQLRPCLERWGDAPSGRFVFAQMLRAQARLGLTRAGVAELLEAARSHEALAPMVSDVRSVTTRGFPPPTSAAELRAIVPAWHDPTELRAAMSEYLTGLGDARRQGEFSKAEQTRTDTLAAFACYVAAFQLDRSNSRAALREATMLLGFPEAQDAATRSLLDNLIEVLFIEKKSAYQKSDYSHIVRLHVVLAQIFMRQGALGGRGFDTHTAVFQLEHALEVWERGTKLKLDMPPASGLHARLGEVYERLAADRPGYQSRASHEYLLAALAFTNELERGQAEKLLSRAGKPSSSDADLFDSVRERIAALPKDE